MRSLIVAVLATSSIALAQHENGGVWTGYVGGWKSNAPGPGPGFAPVLRPRRVTPTVLVPYPVITTTARPEADPAAQQAAERRAWDAEQARLAHQAQLEHERRLAAEREALAVTRAKLEQEAEARRLLAAAQPPLAAPEPARPPAPSTPGNDVYRWTDPDGVVHYSTNVPPEAKPFAKKVGSR